MSGWIEAADEIGDDLREALAHAWADMESDDSDPDLIEMCVGAFRRTGFITQCADVIGYAADAEALPLYRGGDSWWGLAWSVDLGVAHWFAAKFASDGGDGTVWEARCASGGALAYLTERGEVVCDPDYIREVRVMRDAGFLPLKAAD